MRIRIFEFPWKGTGRNVRPWEFPNFDRKQREAASTDGNSGEGEIAFPAEKDRKGDSASGILQNISPTETETAEFPSSAGLYGKKGKSADRGGKKGRKVEGERQREREKKRGILLLPIEEKEKEKETRERRCLPRG